MLSLLSRLLCDYKPKVLEELDCECELYPGLRSVVDIILQLRLITTALNKGNLEQEVPGKGFIVSNLKALQSNLQHLVWQMSQVAKGDFSQRVDFLGEFSASFNSMSERLESYNMELTKLASMDPLTKLANRMQLEQCIESMFTRALAENHVFSVAMIDIDFFKKVNDTYGHDVGDIVLAGAADYLRKVFRSSDFLARYGGEEFIAILPNATKEQALMTVERLLGFFRAHPIVVDDTLSIPVTVSVGVSQYRPGDESPQQITKRSDTALYNAKHNGRNRAEAL